MRKAVESEDLKEIIACAAQLAADRAMVHIVKWVLLT
jgi:hypothetical protein